jgi:hypothetical protein
MEDIMKKKRIFNIALFLFVWVPLVSWAADFDGSRPMLCSVITVIECTPAADRAVSAESIGMPQFIMVDAVKKKLWPAADKERKKTSEIKRIERLGGKLILQGADEGVDKKREGVSWTASISETTGKFILTAAGEEAAFVVFGACLAQ